MANLREPAPRMRVGVLTRTFGLAGAVRCAYETAATPRVATPCDAWIGYSESFVREVRLESCEPHGDALTCQFAGVATPETASELLDRALFLDWEAVSFDDPTSDARLIGYQVVDESGADLGSVDEIMRTPAQYVWSVRFGDREWLMPAVPEFVLSIEREKRQVIVRPIPGMVEEEQHDGDEAEDG